MACRFDCNSTKQYLRAYRFGAALQDEQAWNAVYLPQENVHPHILYQVSPLSVQFHIFHRELQLKRFFRFAHSQLFLKFSRPSKYRLFLFQSCYYSCRKTAFITQKSLSKHIVTFVRYGKIQSVRHKLSSKQKTELSAE